MTTIDPYPDPEEDTLCRCGHTYAMHYRYIDESGLVEGCEADNYEDGPCPCETFEED